MRQPGSGDNVLFTTLGDRCGLDLTGATAAADRHTSNGRWMITYAKGYMDTDQLSRPDLRRAAHPGRRHVTREPAAQDHRSWTLPATVDEINTYACRFDRPFGPSGPGSPQGPESAAAYAVVDNVRELRRAGYPPLRETLGKQEPGYYTYRVDGLPGLTAAKRNSSPQRSGTGPTR